MIKRGSAVVAALLLACGPGGGTTDGGTDGSGGDGGGLDGSDGGVPPLQTSKLDVLLAIDNSASMGDKQAPLAAQLPAFIARLASPWCIPSSDPNGTAVAPSSGQCPNGYVFEFAPVADIHVAIVS